MTVQGGVRKLTLTGNNTFSGGVILTDNVNGNTVQISHINALGTGIFRSESSFDKAYLIPLVNLTADGGVPNAIDIASGKYLNVNTSGDGGTVDLLLSGPISSAVGIGSLYKKGAGTLTLSGANSYTGVTTIDAGSLVATNATSLGTNAAGTIVTSGTTLDVQANIGTEAIIVGGTGVGGTGALVASTGIGTVGGAVTLTDDTSLGGDGTLNVNGAVTGGLNLTKLGAGTTNFGLAGSLAGVGDLTVEAGTTNVNSILGTGTSAVIANGGTTNFGVSQTFASLDIADGAVVTLGTPAPAPALAFDGGFGGAGTSEVAAVPEPGSAALLMGGMLTLLGLRRRKA